MPTEVEIKLVAKSQEAVKGVKELQTETTKLQKTEEQYSQKRKGLIEKEIQMQTQLKEKRDKAANIENLKIYNRLLEDSKKRLDDLNSAGLKIEKQSDSITKSISKWALSIGGATVVLNTLKKAFLETEGGVRILNQVLAVTKQLLNDIVTGQIINISKLAEASRLAKELDNLRLKQRGEAIQTAKLTRDYNELYLEGIDRTKTHAERMVILNKAIDAHNEKYAILINNTKEELLLRQRHANLMPTNTKVVDEYVKSIAALAEIQAEAASGIRRITGMMTGFEQQEIEKALEHQKNIEAWHAEILEDRKKRESEQMALLEKMKKMKVFYLPGMAFPILMTEKDYNEFLEKAKKDIQWALEFGAGHKLGIGTGIVNDKLMQEAQKLFKETAGIVNVVDDRVKWKDQVDLLKKGLEELYNVTQEITDRMVADAQRRRELLDTQISELMQELEIEADLYKEGYANNVTAKKKELEDMKKLREQALRDEEAALEKQRRLEAISQIVNIFTTSTEYFKQFSKLGVAGPFLAAAAITAMFALLASIKSKAANVMKLAEGGHGEVGGRSHAQGGERFLDHVEIEQGERWGVLSRPANRKYGKIFDRMVDSFNRNEIKVDGQEVINNITVDNAGPNNRLDKVNDQLRALNSKRSVTILNDRIVEVKGDTIRTIYK